MFEIQLFDGAEFKLVRIHCKSFNIEGGVLLTNEGIPYFPLGPISVKTNVVIDNVA